MKRAVLITILVLAALAATFGGSWFENHASAALAPVVYGGDGSGGPPPCVSHSNGAWIWYGWYTNEYSGQGQRRYYICIYAATPRTGWRGAWQWVADTSRAPYGYQGFGAW